MREIVVNTFVSLDGVMQAPGGPQEDPRDGFEYGSWIVGYWDEEAGEGPELQVHGSSGLLQTLIAENLVDRFRVWTFRCCWARAGACSAPGPRRRGDSE